MGIINSGQRARPWLQVENSSIEIVDLPIFSYARCYVFSHQFSIVCPINQARVFTTIKIHGKSLRSIGHHQKKQKAQLASVAYEVRLRRHATSPRITCAEEALAAWVARQKKHGETGETQGKNAEKDWGKGGIKVFFSGSYPYCIPSGNLT